MNVLVLSTAVLSVIVGPTPCFQLARFSLGSVEVGSCCGSGGRVGLQLSLEKGWPIIGQLPLAPFPPATRDRPVAEPILPNLIL